MYYSENISVQLIPYIVPLLQTFLTISVYATVAIAVNGYLYVRPATSEDDGGIPQRASFWLRDHR